jgi:hypothetical protein
MSNIDLFSLGVAASVVFCIYGLLKGATWVQDPEPFNATPFMGGPVRRGATNQAPAYGPEESGLRVVDREELLPMLNDGALDLQPYYGMNVGKVFDTVLGGLYYTDRQTCQVVEYVARESKVYFSWFDFFGVPDGSELLYLVSCNLQNVEVPLFYVTLYLGFGAFNNLPHVDHVLAFSNGLRQSQLELKAFMRSVNLGPIFWKFISVTPPERQVPVQAHQERVELFNVPNSRAPLWFRIPPEITIFFFWWGVINGIAFFCPAPG